MPELRPYQWEDVQKLLLHPAMGCFNEQRTGKTPTAIERMAYSIGANKLLIVCPATAIYNWVDEYEKWANCNAIAYVGTPKKRAELLSQWTNGALVISYGTLKATKNKDGEFKQILKQKPQGLIIDEAHRIKDHTSAQARAVFKCLKIPYRLALTGTPAPNKQHEVYSLLYFLRPTEFRSYWNFIFNFFQTTKQYKGYGESYTDIGPLLPHKVQEFQELLNSVSTQRKRKDVMPWLPDKDYNKIFLPVTEQQKKYLSELEQYFETEHITTQGALDRLIRYRQICLHPQLLELKGGSPKLDWLKAYLSDYPDRPTLVFSKFTSFIKILAKEFEKKKEIGIIIGETPIKKRQEIIQAFQEGKLKLLIMNIDTCKEAITLDTAEAIIFTDKYPPAVDIAQAEDRFVSTTEDKSNKPHIIYELIMKDTYDETIYKMIEKRFEEIDIINDYLKYLKEEQ